MAKRVIFSKKAQIDIARIIDFNNKRNGSDTYSKKFFRLLIKRLDLLLKQPLTGIKTDEGALLLIWDQYYIFYNIRNSDIEIESIYHRKEDVL